MSEEPAVSAVIPAFNSEATIARALDSALAQTRPPEEILVVDDHSTDATRDIVARYADRNVQLVELPLHVGAGGARNAGIREASGELVAFLDSDDEWMDTKIEKQVAMIMADPQLSFVACGSNLISTTGVDLGDIYRGQPVVAGPTAWKALLACNFVATPTVLVWRHHLDVLGGFDESLKIGEDQDLWIRLALKGRLGYVHESLVRVHVRENSLSSWALDDLLTYTWPMVERHIAALKEQLSPRDIRQIRGERLNRFGRVAYARGRVGEGLSLLGRSVLLGYRPLESALFMASAAPPGDVVEAPTQITGALMPFKAAAKSLAHRSGLLDSLHRARHGACLTVLMFHRVQPRQEQEHCQSDPIYTVTPDLLAAILGFAKRNYTLVSASEVLSSLHREKPLPSRPLLITFDDGWYDNLKWALPVLQGIRWLLFVATDAASAGENWWQEVLLWAIRTGRASCKDLLDAARPLSTSNNPSRTDSPILGVLSTYAALSESRRGVLLEPYARELAGRTDSPHMLGQSDLSELRARGVDIGSHGASHLPLSLIEDPRHDLRRAQQWLAQFGACPVMSFPHGRYGEAALAAARALGYEGIFTSDPVLNPCPGGWLVSDLIGRIPIGAAAVENRKGGLSPERLATTLYLREIRALSAEKKFSARAMPCAT